MRNLNHRLFSLLANKTTHGGSAALGKRKTKRPFISKLPMHVVLRSSRAQKELSFLHSANKKRVNYILRAQAKKHFVRIFDYVNVGNHLHIKIVAYSRESFQLFLAAITSLIARAMTGAKKGKPLGRFWDNLAFTRILGTRFEEKTLDKYFYANALEAEFGAVARNLFLGKQSWSEVLHESRG